MQVIRTNKYLFVLQFHYFVPSAMVSIIIPYIDEYDYLKEALSSALTQKSDAIEIIVVCNAPSVSEAFQHIAKTNEGVRFIHEPRPGSAHARNAGLQIATGRWVQFLDVDDLLLPNKINHQLQAEHADVIISPHLYRFLSGKQEKSKWHTSDLWVGLLNSGLGSTSSMLWRREALMDANGWNPGFSSHQEYELLFRLMAAGKRVAFIDLSMTIVRQRKFGSITTNSQPVRAMEGIRLRETMWRHLVATQQDHAERYEAFRQYIFKQLRGYYRREASTTLFIYNKYFSEIPFEPKEMHIPGYALLYKLLGFEKTENILSKVARLLKGKVIQ